MYINRMCMVLLASGGSNVISSLTSWKSSWEIIFWKTLSLKKISNKNIVKHTLNFSCSRYYDCHSFSRVKTWSDMIGVHVIKFPYIERKRGRDFTWDDRQRSEQLSSLEDVTCKLLDLRRKTRITNCFIKWLGEGRRMNFTKNLMVWV